MAVPIVTLLALSVHAGPNSAIASSEAVSLTVNSFTDRSKAALEGMRKNYTAIASFQDSASCNPTCQQPPTDYQVTVNWGDHSSSTSQGGGVTVTNSGSYYSVSASHMYADEFNCPGSACGYPLNVHVTDTADNNAFADSGPAGATGPKIAVLDQARDSATSSPVSANVGHDFTNPLGRFHDWNPLASATDTVAGNPAPEFTVSIDWGDGTGLDTSSGSVSGPDASSNFFTVFGGHTYTAPGSYTINVTVSDGLDQKTIGFSTTANVTFKPGTSVAWTQEPGLARAIASGGGSTFLIGTDQYAPYGYHIWRWNGTSWDRFSGAGVRIAVGPDGNPWVVNASHQIYHFVGTSWQQVPGLAYDIASGGGNVFVIGTDSYAPYGYHIWKWNGASWDRFSGAGVRITAGPDGSPYVTNASNQIWRDQNGSWRQLPGSARAIAVAANGWAWSISLTSIGGGNQVELWNGNSWLPIYGGGVEVGAASDGSPWLVNSWGAIYHGQVSD